MKLLAAIASLLVLVLGVSCRQPPLRLQERYMTPDSGLHHVFHVKNGVYSGSAPEGKAAFRELRSMGVKSVVSVDGARPDVEWAQAYGIEYAHIPVGYDGLSQDTAAQLARAFHDMDAPVYVHCHHGKHRGPTAAAVGLIAQGRLSRANGERILEQCGTSQSYPGLWASVRRIRALEQGAIEAAPVAPSIAPVGGFVAGMALIDRAWDHLKLCKESGWATPVDHPDLVPGAEAGMVADTLRQLNQTHEVLDQPEDFIAWMLEAQASASDLERLIIAGAPRAEPDAAFARLAATCKACHVKYRNE